MAASSSPAARLLVIATDDSEATSWIGILREGGIAATAQVASDPDDLRARLDPSVCDLVLCCAHDVDLDVDAALDLYRAGGAGIPLLLLGNRNQRAADLTRAARAGARDLIALEDHAHLRWAVARELADRRQRLEHGGLLERLRECEQRHQAFIESSQDAIAFVQAGMHVRANPAYRRRFGHDTLETLQAVSFLDLIAPDDRQRARDFLHAAEFSASAAPDFLEVTCLDAGGQSFPARLFAARTEEDGESCLRLTVQDLRASVPMTAPLTGATSDMPDEHPGRQRLLDRIESHINPERMVDDRLAVYYIQVLRGWQILNDRGLAHGFEQIAAFGQQLATLLDGRGCLARVTDTGFGLLVVGLDPEEMNRLAAEIRAQARLPRRIPVKADTEADCELGMTLVTGRAPAAEDILDTAYRQCIDRINYELNQASGIRKPTSLASRGMQDQEDGDGELIREIQYALENEKFKLVYQPIISLLGDSQENYSVLIRLSDEDEPMIEARNFIEAAIRGGLIEQVDRWTIRTAIRTLGELQRAGQTINFFINLAEDTFRNPDLIVWICDCLREWNVNGHCLTFQFQEQLAINNVASLGKLSEAFQKIGVRMAINHFGLADNPDLLLQALPVNFVLLSPEYAQRLADDKNKQQRLMSLAGLAREFNLKSVVTGVEDARALTVLWTANVDYVQGNFLQRPSPNLEFQARSNTIIAY